MVSTRKQERKNESTQTTNMIQVKLTRYLLLLLFSLNLFGQAAEENERIIFIPKIVGISETYLGFTAGISLPSDDFGRVQAQTPSGYAQLGFKASLDGAFIFFRNAGLGWTFGHSINALNENAYIREVEHRLPTGSNVTGVFATDSWTNTYLLIGPYMSLPEDQFMLDFGMYAGLAYAKFPETKFEGSLDGNTLTNLERSDQAISPAFYFQIAMNRYIKENFRVFIKGEMLFTRPEFRKIVETTSENFELYSIQDEKQSVGFLGIGAGVAYEFQRKKLKVRKKRGKY